MPTSGSRPCKTPPSPRLFVALWPGPATRTKLADVRSCWTWAERTKPTPAPRLHLTLHFLGPVVADRVPALRSALAAATPVRGFELRIDRAALWPRGLAVLEPAQVPAALTRLHAELAEVLIDRGLTPETRPYRPHVTLARRATGAIPPPQSFGVRWPVRGFALVASDHGYTVLQRYRFHGG